MLRRLEGFSLVHECDLDLHVDVVESLQVFVCKRGAALKQIRLIAPRVMLNMVISVIITISIIGMIIIKVIIIVAVTIIIIVIMQERR